MGTRNDLAELRAQRGDVAGAIDVAAAIAELEKVLRGHQRASHPETLTVRAYLASWRGEGGHFPHAISESEALLADQIRMMGPRHPHTFATRGNLANRRGRSGDVAGTIRDFQALLTDVTRVLGPNHPHTKAARKNFDYWRSRR